MPFGLMSITGLTPGRTVLVLLILITGNLLGALWADRFGFKSLMVWSAGFFWGALFLMLSHYTVLMKQFNFKNIESMWGHPILMFLGGAVATVTLVFYKSFASFKESLKAQSFFWMSCLGVILPAVGMAVIGVISFVLTQKIFPKLPVAAGVTPFAVGAVVVWVLLIQKFFPFVPICQDKEPFWNAIKGVFKKEYVAGGMAVGLLLGLIYFGAEPLWKKEWISKWNHPDGSSGGTHSWIDFALAAPALGALVGFIVTWIRCRLGADSIAELTATEKIQFARRVIVRMLIFAGSGYGLFRWIKALESPTSDLIALLEPLEDKFILSIEAVTYISYGLFFVHVIIFTIVFYRLFARALIMYHYNLFEITHQAKNHGAFAAMTWVVFVASVAFLFHSMKRFVV
ncbi:MAG: hypothetical protein BGO07_00730 [Alphaproteobacteria bacterium 40-19]|nr:MAG: hypothetical protein BGO07_00730 [Alphaproteobacteria bacterium 40-19]